MLLYNLEACEFPMLIEREKNVPKQNESFVELTLITGESVLFLKLN